MRSKLSFKTEDVMNQEVLTVQHDQNLHEVVNFLLKHKISNAPVVRKDSGGSNLLGFISQADCLKALANELYFSSKEQTALEIIKTNPYCVSPDEDIFTPWVHKYCILGFP